MRRDDDPLLLKCMSSGPELATEITAYEAALLRHLRLVEQIEADRADPSRAVRSEARRPR